MEWVGKESGKKEFRVLLWKQAEHRDGTTSSVLVFNFCFYDKTLWSKATEERKGLIQFIGYSLSLKEISQTEILE